MKLGNKDAQVDGVLEWFPISESSPHLDITLVCNEFTCRCPVTHQPDWATIVIKYEPHLRVVESKSLKMYLETFRDTGVFHEHLAQQVLGDFRDAIQPWECKVTVHFNTRGGIAISATATYDPVEKETNETRNPLFRRAGLDHVSVLPGRPGR